MILRLPDSGKRLSYELERKAVGNINLRVRPDGSIYVSAPSRTPQESIESFLIAREKWILRALERVTDRTDAYPDLPVLAQRDSVPYLGGSLRVQYAACNSRKGHWSLDEPAGLLRVELPDPTSDSWRIGALQSFEKQRTQELVQEYLRQYLPLFAERGVAAPAAVRFRIMQSRWGSCSGRTHSLSFNARLCERPHAFIEYVVVHELCHFLHGNHSADFWREVERYLPDWQAEREKSRGFPLWEGSCFFQVRGCRMIPYCFSRFRRAAQTASWTSSVTP